MRVRIRRFGGLSYLRRVDFGIPSESKQALAQRNREPDCSPISTDCERCRPFEWQGLYPRPASVIQRTASIPDQFPGHLFCTHSSYPAPEFPEFLLNWIIAVGAIRRFGSDSPLC